MLRVCRLCFQQTCKPQITNPLQAKEINSNVQTKRPLHVLQSRCSCGAGQNPIQTQTSKAHTTKSYNFILFPCLLFFAN